MDAGYGVHTGSAHEHHEIGLELCRRHPVTHDRMGAWHRAASAEEVSRVMGDHRSCCAAMTSTNRPRSRSFALALPKRAWSHDHMAGRLQGMSCTCRFARVRVRVAHRDFWLADSRPRRSGC